MKRRTFAASAFAWCSLTLAGVALIFSATIARAEEPARAQQGEAGFWRFAGTLSPDGKYVLAWAPAGLSDAQVATLKEWDQGVKFDNDIENAMNFLMDAEHGKVLTEIETFSYFAGPEWRQNRHDLYIAWSADCRTALAIYSGRWEDEDVVWIDAPARRVTSVNKQLCHAFYAILRKREKQMEEVSTHFEEAAILPGGVLAVSAFGWIPKEGPGYDYRLTFRVAAKGDKVRLELLEARKMGEDEHPPNPIDPDPTLNAAYGKLRGRLDEKGRAALKTEELAWLKWRDALPAEAHDGVTAQRAALLKARAEQ